MSEDDERTEEAEVDTEGMGPGADQYVEADDEARD